MARLIFPDEGSRLVYVVSSLVLGAKPTTVVTFYSDAAATVLADLRTYDGTPTPGAVIIGSTLTTDTFSRIPLFWGPDAVDTLYVKVGAGPVSPVYARTDDRIDAIETTLGTGPFLPLTGGTMTGSVLMRGDESGGPDQTDSTPRLTVQSWQTNGDNFFGETLRADGMGPITKNSIAYRLPRPAISTNSSLATQVAGDIMLVGPSNIGFETDTAGWSTFGTITAFVTDSSVHASGSQSGKVTFGAGQVAGTAGITIPVTPLIVGNYYVARAWVRSLSGGTNKVALSVNGTHSATALTSVTGVQSVTEVSDYTIDSLWHQLIYVFRATATTHTLTLGNSVTTTASSVWVDQVYVTPALTDPPRSTVWALAHYWPQSGANALLSQGHWSIEVPDANDNLQTRFEIKFIDSTGKIGVDKTLIQTHNADFVVDTSAGGGTGRFRLTNGAGADRLCEVANDAYGTHPRWVWGCPGGAETGGSVGSEFAIGKYNDADVITGYPFVIKRSNGLVIIGGSSIISGQTDGTIGGGLQVNRAAAGTAVLVNTNLTGATGAVAVDHNALDATSRTLQGRITSDAASRIVVFVDGKHEWGPGTSRDTNLYRAGVSSVALLGILATDSIFKAKPLTTASRPTPASATVAAMYYDTTLSKPVWSDGTNWRDAAGTIV